MLYRCEYCGKGASVGHAVSHAKNRSQKINLPNLQWRRVDMSGKKLRVRLCTSCIKTMKRDAQALSTSSIS
jgi:large subunit ribosomal protein L28